MCLQLDIKANAIFVAKPPQPLKPLVTSSGVNLILVEELIQRKLYEKLKNNIFKILLIE